MLNDIISISNLVNLAVAGGVALGISQWRLGRIEEDGLKKWEVINKGRQWQHDYEVSSLRKQIEDEKRLAEVQRSVGKVEIQFVEAEKRTQKIEAKIDHISMQIEKLMEQISSNRYGKE